MVEYATASEPQKKGNMSFPRITQNPVVMGGQPCIRGLRVTVSMLVGQIGAGRSIEDLLADYPYLERDDILEALRFADDR